MSVTVEEFLAPYSPQVRELAMGTRQLVLDAMPDAIEQVNTGHKVISYSTGNRMSDQILYISPHKGHVNLGFLRGTQLPDPEGLLEGTGKMLRHVKIKKLEDLDKPELRLLLRTAVQQRE